MKVFLISDYEIFIVVLVFCNKVGLFKVFVFEVGVVLVFIWLCVKRDKIGVIYDFKIVVVSYLWFLIYILWVVSYNWFLICWECNEGVKVGGYMDDIRL